MAEFLGEASVLIRPDTTGFRAALVAQLAKATAGISVPVAVVPAGLSSGKISKPWMEIPVANERVAASAAIATSALTEEAAAASAAGASAARSAVPILASAKAHEQLARGAGASALALGGLRGATLAASGPFLIGAAAITTIAKSMHEASNEAEALAAVTRVLGEEGARTSEVWAKQLAASFGLSAAEALRSEAGFAQLFRVQGIGVEQAQQLSQRFTELAQDMSTFLGLPVERVFGSLQLGIAGNIRGFKTLKIVTSAAEIQQRALALSGKATTAELTRQDLVLARVSIILQQTANAQGAYKARSDELAQSSKTLQANLHNLEVEIGNALIPVLTQVTKTLNDFFFVANTGVGAIRRLKTAIEDAIPGGEHLGTVLKGLSFVSFAGPLFVASEGLHRLRDALDSSSAGADHASSSFTAFAQVLDIVNGAVQSLSNVLSRGQTSEQKLLSAQIAGDQQTQLDILANQIDAAGRRLGRAIPGTDEFTKAQQDLLNKMNARKALLEEMKTASDKTTTVAKSAGDAKAKADQAFLNAQEFARGQAELAIARAQNTKSLGDDIRAEIHERNLVLRQIAEIRKSNLAQGAKKLAIQAATLILIGVNGAIKDLNAQKAANRKAARDDREQRRKERQDALLESLQLDIQFAQTTGNVAKEERAHRALIRELRKRLRNKHLSIVERKRLRNAIAEEEKAIKELTAAEKKKNNAAASLQFEFLQAQQGFAANLLSNILPASAFGGTVGGSTGTGVGGLPISSFQGGREDPTRGLGGAAAVAQASQRTASQSQMSVLIELTRQIVAALMKQQRGAGHPEARHQRSAGSSNMDIL